MKHTGRSAPALLTAASLTGCGKTGRSGGAITDSGRLTRLEVYDASGTLEGYVTYEYAA